MELSQILQNAQSADERIRNEAQSQLLMAEQNNLGMYLLALTAELADNNKNALVRQLAGIVIKNRLYSKDDEKSNQYETDWRNLDVNIKLQIKTGLLQTLASVALEPRQTAAQVSAKIAAIDLPNNQWPNLIDILLNNMTQNNANLKQGTLSTLGYICEEIDPNVVQDKSNQILTAVVQGMVNDETNNEVKLAATRALYNALEFAKPNFEKEKERNVIMQVVLEVTQCPDVHVRVSGFECLGRIASIYYEKLPQYIQRIFNITLEAIKKDEEDVVLQAIEFWSSVCDVEIDLLEEIKEAQEMRVPPTVECHNFIRGALQYLVPLLLETLTKQDENADPDGDDWTVDVAGATCLSLIANTVVDDVVAPVLPFVQNNITNPNWRNRDAALMAFGSILEGPTVVIGNLIEQAIVVILQHMKDPVEQVKDSASWTVVRICQLHPQSIRNAINAVMTSLVESLVDIPRVASNAAWAINKIAEACENDDDKPCESLAPYFQVVVTALWRVTERPDGDDNHLRNSAYEAISALLRAATPDCDQLVVALVPLFMDRLEQTFAMQILNKDDRQRQSDIQSYLCSVLQNATIRLGANTKPLADRMMNLYLRVFTFKAASLHEEALMAVGAVCDAVGVEFEKYMPAFKPFLILGLRNYEEYQVCNIAVSVVGNIAGAIVRKLEPYCEEIISNLLQNLQAPQLNRSVKPPILSCFGDIALAISGGFVPYLNLVMMMLQQAAALEFTIDKNDDDEVDWLNNLRECIFEAYTGILQGLREDKKVESFVPFVPPVLSYVCHVAQDGARTEEVTRGAIGVIGDLGHALGSAVKDELHADFIKKLLKECQQSNSKATREVAKWTESMIYKL